MGAFRNPRKFGCVPLRTPAIIVLDNICLPSKTLDHAQFLTVAILPMLLTNETFDATPRLHARAVQPACLLHGLEPTQYNTITALFRISKYVIALLKGFLPFTPLSVLVSFRH